MLFEFCVYSVVMELLLGVALLGGVHMYAWRERMVTPVLEALQGERIIAQMEHSFAGSPINPAVWYCGDGMVGWKDGSRSVRWIASKEKLWYERDGSRTPVWNRMSALHADLEQVDGMIRSVRITIHRNDSTRPLSIYIVLRRALFPCIVS